MNFYLGNELIALGAIAAGASSVYAYPGTPSSEILTAFQKFAPSRYAQWSINEKIALELASAAAISGSHSLCVMKQVGLNVAADPLFSVAYTGVTGALVIVSADDPGPHSSQTEQDSRLYAYAAKIPVFDPASPKDAFDLTQKAFQISKKYGIPVIVRPVMRVCHSRSGFNQPENMGAEIKGKFVKDASRWAATPKFRAALHLKLIEKLNLIAHEFYDDIKIEKRHATAIIASGYAYAVCVDIVEKFKIETDIIKIDMPHPISPKFLDNIEKTYDKILVLEETFPLVEQSFTDRRKVFGKLSGTVISAGEFTADACISAMELFFGKTFLSVEKYTDKSAQAPAKPRLCAGCGHRSAFYAIKRAAPSGIYAGDIGCYTLGTNLKAVDTCICMGASIAFAESLKRENPEKPVIATIGDSTFFHTGIPALLNAKINDAPIVLTILDNGTTAMTGFQPVPHSNGKVSIEKVIEGMGFDFIKVCDPYEIQKSVALVKEALNYAETSKTPAVIIFRRECVTETKKIYGKPPIIIEDGCTNCGICYEIFECPALSEEDGKAVLDETSCNGCMCCVQICPKHVIKENE